MEQEIKMLKRNNKILMGILIIFILLCIGLGVNFVFKNDNNIDDSSNQNINKTNNDNIVKEVSVTNNDQLTIKEANISIIVPKIVNGGTNSEKINEEIENFVNSDVSKNLDMVLSVKVGYSYVIINDVIAIDINVLYGSWPGSGSNDKHYNIFYHINNDEKLDASDAARIMQIKDLGGASSYDDLNTCTDFIINDNTITIKYYGEECI